MSKKNLRQLDYQKVAKLDSDMWRAYYDHRFLKLFLLLVQLMHAQFQFGWFLALKAAYYSGFAATDYRINRGHEPYARVERHITKFYKAISDHATEPFDYRKAAKLELEWWNIHRYPKKYEKTLEASLAECMATIYSGNQKDFIEYAHYRAEAMVLRDEAGDVKKIEPDWQKIESLLLGSWKVMLQAAQKVS